MSAMEISHIIASHLDDAFAKLQRRIDSGELSPSEVVTALSLVWGDTVLDAWNQWQASS